MVKVILLAFIINLQLLPLLGAPNLVGLSTYYGPPAFVDGDTMANGEPLDTSAPTVAVDVSHRDEWLNKEALILTECGTFHIARVTDTGKLYDVGGWFQKGTRGSQYRYWPVDIETELEPVLITSTAEETIWESPHRYQVVADFPEHFYNHKVACHKDSYGKGDTMLVKVWLLE